jgi:hypothetical protein
MRKSPDGEEPAPVAFFTERTLASFLAVSDRTIRKLDQAR